MTLAEKLMRIQTQIKAPKNLYNSFGNYKYRNAEGICEAVKPYLEKEKVALILTDEVHEIGGRVYVKAVATLLDSSTDERLSVEAFAREQEKKKGMDDSQITGTASSYARKYALNGLFLLDDTKDPDTDEYRVQAEAQAEKQRQIEEQERLEKSTINKVKIDALLARCEKEQVDPQTIEKLCGVKDVSEITEKQYYNINQMWGTDKFWQLVGKKSE